MTQELTWRFASKMRNVPAEQVPSGPWGDEPDKVQWVDEATGYDCLIVRGPSGALCGYVGLPPEHPFYELDYSQIEGTWDYETHSEKPPLAEIRVHGGLTFADFCTPGEPIEGICHIAEHGATEKPWWLGFDCAHVDDDHPQERVVAASMREIYGDRWRIDPYRRVYRDIAYVKQEVRDLAAQLKAVA